jgi:hypothetical protein
MTDEISVEKLETKKLSYKASKEFAATYLTDFFPAGATVWSPSDVDKLEIQGLSEFKSIINDCRFFYRREPIANTVINKLVEIAINDIIFEKNGLSENEFRIFTGIKDSLLDYMEKCALEYLITGIVIPEIKYSPVTKKELNEMGVKKYNTLELPTSMWLRDPTTVEIKSTQVLDEPSYFIVLPEEVVTFIRNGGEYSNGEKDTELFNKIKTRYPEFVEQINKGNTKFLIKDDKLIIRCKVITGSQYPTPYLYPALESLKHKRNIRRMDYAIAARVIAAIMLVKLGNDNFPVTEKDENAFDDIRDQMMWRGSGNRDVERIFMLFANHTLEIEWITPDVETLLNSNKYAEINQEIFYALGFPKILTVGETDRTQTSDPNIATLSPIKTMETMRRHLMKILNAIIYHISESNGLKTTPKVRFDQIKLYSMTDLIELMKYLYETSNISRETFAKTFGFDFQEEAEKRAVDEKLIESLGIPAFSPQPFSPQPEQKDKETDDKKEKKENNKEKLDKKE